MSIEQFEKEIFPAVFNKNGVKYLSSELNSESVTENSFRSSVVFITVTVCKDGVKVKIPVVAKIDPFSENTRKILQTQIMFNNEVFMYSQMLPYINKENIVEETFPKFYYGKSSDPDNSVIMLEDLKLSKYCTTESCTYLDFAHLSIVFAKLGRFHALSYAAKERSLEEFFKMTSNLKDHLLGKELIYQEMVKANIHRAVDPLVAKGRHVELLKRFLNRVDNNYVEIFLNLISPDDPISVVCHGDFCKNNIHFQYTDGKPTDVKFFDIATSRCSSPVIDISFLLFLNSSKDLRDAHLDDLLECYHTSLSSSVPGTGVPSLQEIKEAVRQKAIWGFVHCSYFLPMMLYDTPIDVQDMLTWGIEDILNFQTAIGGEEGTQVLSDLVEELVDKQFLTLEHSWM